MRPPPGTSAEHSSAGRPGKLCEPHEEATAEDPRAGGDEKKRVVLSGLDPGRRAPREGYGLLLVLPGGDGSIDFHPFVKRIHQHAVPRDFLTVQFVAPAWTEKQA
ncbi:MAG: hypothetical protein HY812_13720 [Planctomycetes bacterium]|nr:hypothetical protein [Planctomycetota bacterium]